MSYETELGAWVAQNGVTFRVWTENTQQIEVVIYENGQEKFSRILQPDKKNYFSDFAPGLKAGTQYMYRLDGDKLRADPASRYQPDTVHSYSQVVDPFAFEWHDSNWQGLPLEAMAIYEVHIGTATEAGTFEAFIEKLDYVKSLGITAIEIMPVADFPGQRNWGYDGVDLFAPARPYGGPEGLRKLVDAAHLRGLAVIQDVVYNHFGPDGNYLRDFSPDYFTDKEKTPWGDAVNYANPEVREFFVANALHWVYEYHMDGLRLDATHAILDHSPEHILKEIVRRVRESLPKDRHFIFFAEDERNEVNLVQPIEQGGLGLDAVWADDFHHQVRSSVAGDNEGYYADFSGKAEDIAETLGGGWFYAGQLSDFSGKPRGTNATKIDPPHFVYCIQNHDQIGNRAIGDRLNDNIDLESYRAASALLLLSPYTPLLFQGQEWAASTPFLFFTDFNPELGRLVTEGRRAEFAHFSGFSGEQVPDPQAISTFEASKLKWAEAQQGEHAQTLALYRHLLNYRQTSPFLQTPTRQNFQAACIAEDAIAIRYCLPNSEKILLVLINLKNDLELQLNEQEITRPPKGKSFELVLSSNQAKYGGNESDDLKINQVLKQTGTIRSEHPVAYLLQIKE